VRVRASLLNGAQAEVATGWEDVLAVDWKNQPLSANGALLDGQDNVGAFLRGQRGLKVADYSESLGRLDWVVADAPAGDTTSSQRLIDRARKDGTTLIVLTDADRWAAEIARLEPSIHYHGSFIVGKAWSGGVHFVREHPLFAGLPTNCGMDWPYQAVVRDGTSRSGLLLDGDELVAGAFHSNMSEAYPPAPIALGTAVGVLHIGKGKVILSTLDIASNLSAPGGPAEVARKLLCNFIEYSSSP
jgi:hypothetical protein